MAGFSDPNYVLGKSTRGPLGAGYRKSRMTKVGQFFPSPFKKQTRAKRRKGR